MADLSIGVSVPGHQRDQQRIFRRAPVHGQDLVLLHRRDHRPDLADHQFWLINEDHVTAVSGDPKPRFRELGRQIARLAG